MTAILNFLEQTGYQFAQDGNWKCLIMMEHFLRPHVSGHRQRSSEPLLLLPIAFGMLMTNLPGAEMFHGILFVGGHVHWDLFGGLPSPLSSSTAWRASPIPCAPTSPA